MTHYDIFNGDADGICSLIQLRLAEPRESVLVTGVKRDIKLLAKANLSKSDSATVLDISMEKNAEALSTALNAGASIFYADHHRSGDIPDHDNLDAHINTAPNTCTALIIDAYLKGKFREWAIVAAYGDNIIQVADRCCAKLGLSSEKQAQLRKLGIAINYNGYGSTVADLHYSPESLYEIACRYSSPFDFIANEREVFESLVNGYDEDMAKALSLKPDKLNDSAAMIRLPDERWARRVNGVLGNELANKYPSRAHAILTTIPGQTDRYQISIRAPKTNPTGADIIATQFGGGGRKNAAGINEIARSDLVIFWKALVNAYN